VTGIGHHSKYEAITFERGITHDKEFLEVWNEAGESLVDL
jgi:hypothetical protein